MSLTESWAQGGSTRGEVQTGSLHYDPSARRSGMHFSVVLTCKVCKTEVRYDDERPAWKTYDFRVEQAEECERSAAFVVAWDGKPVPETWTRYGREWPEWAEAGHPRFIRSAHRDDPEGLLAPDYVGEGSTVVLAIPKSYRYIDCPVCDAQIKEPGR